MVPSSLLVFLPGGGLVDPLLRASNEALPRARAPRAGGRPGRPPLLLQSAEEGVPREVEERETARFLRGIAMLTGTSQLGACPS
jgi:hypothetical protein